ncbi:unnamed protein product [Acanthoscelides obtectus]|uniref:Uncharacterized protein n=1 Tax=Acanthoscelides obtectus TaxID=200917 RepID=A0A9P0LUR5_ACAOB|nr:unnamed protein product [Acanthoscelides obtectus]CAK1662415.1 hypothetical protein AOBTE_LOCUS23138 [Acanthoscelides obtectus]
MYLVCLTKISLSRIVPKCKQNSTQIFSLLKLKRGLRFGTCIPNCMQIKQQKEMPGRKWSYFFANRIILRKKENIRFIITKKWKN